jgi:hypothetical protein
MPDADDVRTIAFSLPQTQEKLAWGQPTFRVRGKTFASLSDDDASVGVMCPPDERAELIASEPEKFFIRPGHDDGFAWLRVRLAALDDLDDLDELRAILFDSWRQAAPGRLAATYDAPRADGPSSAHDRPSAGRRPSACSVSSGPDEPATREAAG